MVRFSETFVRNVQLTVITNNFACFIFHKKDFFTKMNYTHFSYCILTWPKLSELF